MLFNNQFTPHTNRQVKRMDRFYWIVTCKYKRDDFPDVEYRYRGISEADSMFNHAQGDYDVVSVTLNHRDGRTIKSFNRGK